MQEGVDVAAIDDNATLRYPAGESGHAGGELDLEIVRATEGPDGIAPVSYTHLTLPTTPYV